MASIGKEAFRGSGLTEFMYVSSNETNFGEYAFLDCHSLKTVHLAGQISNLPSTIFLNCTALESVYLGESVRTINGNAFQGCTSLARIELPNADSWFDKNLEPYVVPVKPSLGIYEYRYCFRDHVYSLYVDGEKVENITVPNGITELRRGQFYNNIGLKSVNLSDVETIGDNAFDNCKNLAKITMTGSQKNGYRVFFRLDRITDVYYDTYSPKSFYELFSTETQETATLHVRPEAMELICQTSPWLYFVNIVADITDSGIDEIEAADGEMMCDVYSMDGVMVRGAVKWAEWNTGLTPGIYIVRLADGSVRKAVAR